MARAIITEDELIEFKAKQEDLKGIKRQLSALEGELETLESDLLMRLKAGSKVSGKLLAVIETKEGARRPHWKDAFLNLAIRMGLNPAKEERAVVEATFPPVKEVLLIVPKQQ